MTIRVISRQADGDVEGGKTCSVITNCSLDVLWVARVYVLQFSNPFYYMPSSYVYVTLVKIVVNHAKSISPDNNGEREDRLIILRVVGGELSLVLSVYWSGVEYSARQ